MCSFFNFESVPLVVSFALFTEVHKLDEHLVEMMALALNLNPDNLLSYFVAALPN